MQIHKPLFVIVECINENISFPFMVSLLIFPFLRFIFICTHQNKLFGESCSSPILKKEVAGFDQDATLAFSTIIVMRVAVLTSQT